MDDVGAAGTTAPVSRELESWLPLSQDSWGPVEIGGNMCKRNGEPCAPDSEMPRPGRRPCEG